MDWQSLLDSDIRTFIKTHEQDDVKALALKKAPDASWPYGCILDQIKVRQKAKIKTPELYRVYGFIFPENETYEQVSSGACAAYKASLVSGVSFVDLTAGGGVDGFSFSKRFDVSSFVEKNPVSAKILEHNALIVGGDIDVVHDDALSFVKRMSATDFVFIDPQRREKGRKGLYDLSETAPDVLAMVPLLKTKTKQLMIKASPFLDIEKAVSSLQWVKEVHVVQWDGDCKEVLYWLDFEAPAQEVMIKAVDLNDDGTVKAELSFLPSEEKAAQAGYVMPARYIYEPGAAFQKAGGFNTMSVRYGVGKLHPHTHLYTSEQRIEGFPGKVYEVKGVCPVKSKELPVKKADLKLRNFPGTPDLLRKKLKLADGGDHRVFAATLCDEKKKLIICFK